MDRKEISFEELKKEVEEWRKTKPDTDGFYYFSHFKDLLFLLITLLVFLIAFIFYITWGVIKISLFPIVAFTGSLLFSIYGIIIGLCGKTFIKKRVCIYLEKKEKSLFWKTLFFFQKIALKIIALIFLPAVKWKLKLDIEHTGSVGRILEWLQDLTGIEGYWEKFDYDEAIRKVVYCPIALDTENKKCPGLCNELLKRTIGDYLNTYSKDIELSPIEKTLLKGDKFCEFRLKRRLVK